MNDFSRNQIRTIISIRLAFKKTMQFDSINRYAARSCLGVITHFRIGDSSACLCGTSPMTVEHFLQDCQTHQKLRAETWPADTPVREKIYDPVEVSSVLEHASKLPGNLSERTTTTTKKKSGR